MAPVAFCDYVSGMPQNAPGRSQEQFMVRMPDGMRGRLADVAKANGRSMNAEVIARLAQSLNENGLSGVLVSGDAITAELLVQKIVEGVVRSVSAATGSAPAKG